MSAWLRTAISSGVIVAIGVVGMIAPRLGWAEVIDPNFTVCVANTNGSCGNDPNTISTTGSFNAFTFGNSGLGPLNPFLLLFAVPNLNQSGAASFNPGFTGTDPQVQAATGQEYDQTTPVQSNGYLGELTANPSNDLYSFAGLKNGNSSESFANFTKYFEFLINQTPNLNPLGGSTIPSSYSVYEYTALVSGGSTNLGNGTVYNIPYTSFPLGTFVAAYGVDKCGPDVGTGPCPDAKFVYDSAFTVSGFTDGGGQLPPATIPEPGTLALLGISLTALAFVRRRPAAK